MSSKFNLLSSQELRHADRIAMEIISNGGKAEWNFELPAPETSVRKILKVHIDKESDAIVLYREILKLIEDYDFNLVLNGIIANEQEHLEIIARILRHIK